MIRELQLVIARVSQFLDGHLVQGDPFGDEKIKTLPYHAPTGVGLNLDRVDAGRHVGHVMSMVNEPAWNDCQVEMEVPRMLTLTSVGGGPPSSRCMVKLSIPPSDTLPVALMTEASKPRGCTAAHMAWKSAIGSGSGSEAT